MEMNYWKNKDGQVVRGKWAKLDDGTFGASIRLRDHSNVSVHVGKIVQVLSKDGKFSDVRLVELVRDYGVGDVTIYRCERI